MNIKFSI